MRHHRFALLFTLLAAQATAQRVWTVDAQGRPGTDFLDLPEAVATAADEDVLRVRDGSYTSFETTKGLTILGEPGATVDRGSGPLTVSDLPAERRFVVTGLSLWQPAYLQAIVRVQRCTGPTFFQAVRIEATGAFGFDVIDAQRVSIVSSYVWGRIRAARSALLLADDFISGNAAGTPGIELTDGVGEWSRCEVFGGPAPLGWTAPAAVLVRSRVTITGDGQVGYTGAGFMVAGPAIGGDVSELVWNPVVPLVAFAGGPAVAPGIAVVQDAVPSLQAVGGVLGGSLVLDVFAAPGDVAAVFVGAPRAALPVSPLGTLWLEPGATRLLFVQGIGAGSHAGLALVLPLVPLAGLTLPWQGAVLTPAGVVRLTNPTATTLR
jgi:hypothetical protein